MHISPSRACKINFTNFSTYGTTITLPDPVTDQSQMVIGMLGLTHISGMIKSYYRVDIKYK